MDKKNYFSILGAFVTISMVLIFILLAAPIAKPLAWALIIGIATLPHHTSLAKRLPNHRNSAAGLMVIAITLCLILPFAASIIIIIQNASDWYAEAGRLTLSLKTTGAGALNHSPLAREIIAIGDKYGINLSELGAKLSNSASEYLFNLATNTAINIGELLFTVAVALFILFFIYRDGESIVFSAIERFSTNQDKARHYYTEICSTTTAVTVGTILTCLVQGLTAGVGYYAADTPAPVLWGAITALAALVPVVGTGLVWIPLAVLVAIHGAYLKAFLLSLWCIIFVGLADNAIRPLAIGAKSNIPTAAIVLGAICGVFEMGILGLILGPILFAIVCTVWRDITGVYQQTEADVKQTDYHQ